MLAATPANSLTVWQDWRSARCDNDGCRAHAKDFADQVSQPLPVTTPSARSSLARDERERDKHQHPQQTVTIVRPATE